MGTLEKIAVADLRFRLVFGPPVIVFVFSWMACWDLLGMSEALAAAIAAVPAALTGVVMYRLLQ